MHTQALPPSIFLQRGKAAKIRETDLLLQLFQDLRRRLLPILLLALPVEAGYDGHPDREGPLRESPPE